MAINAHLNALEQRHKALKAAIEQERLHPSQDNLKISNLKRRKLLIKDEMEKLEAELSKGLHH